LKQPYRTRFQDIDGGRKIKIKTVFGNHNYDDYDDYDGGKLKD
jgi:hypothetical protein